MKKNRYQVLAALTLLFGMLLLTACTAEAAGGAPASSAEEEVQTGQEEQPETTLEDLLGGDYVNYLTETITMQMGNRMEKDPEIRYYPIDDDAPLTDYVVIDETTEFEVDEEGNPVILFPAGTVTDEANGAQSFRIPKLYQ